MSQYSHTVQLRTAGDGGGDSRLRVTYGEKRHANRDQCFRRQLRAGICRGARAARPGVSAVSDRDQTEAVIPFAPKLNARSDLNDPLEKAGHLILDMVRQASGNAQASYQQAAEMSRKLSAQLRSAEDRIRELETKLRHHEDRADRAERWLHHISVEIEQKFFGRDKADTIR